MVRYFIELAYNGSRYHGWQIPAGSIVRAGRNQTGPSVLCYARTYTSSAPVERIRVYTLHFSSLHFDIECELPEPQPGGL